MYDLSPQGTGGVPTDLSIVFTTPSVPLIGDRNGAQTASLYGWRTIRGLRQQQSCGFLCGDEPAFTQGFAKSICPFRRAGCVSFCPNTIPESESSIPDLSHQAAEGGQIAAFEQGIVARIGGLVVGFQGVEDFADFLKFLTVRRYGLEGMTGEQIGLGQL